MEDQPLHSAVAHTQCKKPPEMIPRRIIRLSWITHNICISQEAKSFN